MHTLLFVLYLGLFSGNPVVNAKYVNNTTRSHYIYYDASRKLKWPDFKDYYGKRKEAAITASEISYQFTMIGDVINVEVTCAFNKNNSIVMQGHKNDYILNHEQRHFDISYLFAKKFVNELNSRRNMNIEEIDRVYNKIIAEWNAYQDRYDEETKNSVSKEGQDLWNQKIEHDISLL